MTEPEQDWICSQCGEWHSDHEPVGGSTMTQRERITEIVKRLLDYRVLDGRLELEEYVELVCTVLDQLEEDRP